MIRSKKIGKIGEVGINEDAVISRSNLIAVSDGAGGGGLFADKWSAYLVENLPNTPILSSKELDDWIGCIWEPFYNQCEADAKRIGGMTLDKFYDEGAFATLAAAWCVDENECQWITYGDSVVFWYNTKTNVLYHSFGSLADFDNPPYLINCKDELNHKGFTAGTFSLDTDTIVLVTSDALAHYILMMYEVANRSLYETDLQTAESAHTKNENYIKAAKVIRKIDFRRNVIGKLVNCTKNSANFARHISSLLRKGLIANDDYSIAVLQK